jgi:hypothetical protein
VKDAGKVWCFDNPNTEKKTIFGHLKFSTCVVADRVTSRIFSEKSFIYKMLVGTRRRSSNL